MAHWNQCMLQDPTTHMMYLLTSFHDMVLMLMVLVMSIVSSLMIMLLKNKYSFRMMNEAHNLETIWTVIPGLLLLLLALPSIRLLYTMDEIINPALSVKAIGHQWYWSYEYSDFQEMKFDSYMVPESNLKMGDFRLLEVDNRLTLPNSFETRLLVTSSDVIHSWSIPSMGVKVDAIPGRLNQVSIIPNQVGIFYGQCSEICGMNHSFMPIVVQSIPHKNFLDLVSNFNN